VNETNKMTNWVTSGEYDYRHLDPKMDDISNRIRGFRVAVRRQQLKSIDQILQETFLPGFVDYSRQIDIARAQIVCDKLSDLVSVLDIISTDKDISISCKHSIDHCKKLTLLHFRRFTELFIHLFCIAGVSNSFDPESTTMGGYRDVKMFIAFKNDKFR
jgi:hypothetical protein